MPVSEEVYPATDIFQTHSRRRELLLGSAASGLKGTGASTSETRRQGGCTGPLRLGLLNLTGAGDVKLPEGRREEDQVGKRDLGIQGESIMAGYLARNKAVKCLFHPRILSISLEYSMR